MGLFDGLASAVLGFFGAKEQNASAKQIAAEQNRMAIELASTQHQREVADLKAAGLNPILSAGGSGAAVPNLATAPVVNEMEGALSSAQRGSQLRAALDNLEADTASKTESAKLAAENQGVAAEMRQKTVADYWKTDAEKHLTRQLEANAKKDNFKKDLEMQLIQAQIASARNAARISNVEAQSAEDMTATFRNLEKGGAAAGGLARGAKTIYDMFRPRSGLTINTR